MDEHKGHSIIPIILFFIGLFLFFINFFIEPSTLKNTIAFITMVASGYHVIGEGFGETYTETKKLKKFTPNVHVLMALAAFGAALIGNFTEGALLILIFSSAHFMEEYVEDKSKKEITSLMKLQPTTARLILDNGQTKMIDISELKIGDTVQVLNGEQIPADGIILNGTSTIDQSSINGESMPIDKSVGDSVFASTINGSGILTLEVSKDASDTVFAKILKLVDESQQNISKTATKIKKLEPKYVTTVLILVPAYIILAALMSDMSWYDSFYKGMVFLTVASPCALAASDIPATLSAISNLAKKGILFKGGSYLSNLSEIKAIAFDKTGTLTEGKPKVTNIHFTSADTIEKQTYMNIIVAMEQQSNHPLAQAIASTLDKTEHLNIDVENHIGKGVSGKWQEHTYTLAKPDFFGTVPESISTHYLQYTKEGKTVVYFAKDDIVIGLIALMDVPNEQAAPLIAYFKSQNVHTIMLTGDSVQTGQAVADQIKIDEIIGNILPEEKSSIIDDMKKKYGITAMIGDGVNDAPALVKADIGIAMGDGTDVAIDVADAVLMKNDLTKLKYAHRMAKKTDKIITQNIIFAMSVVVLLVILNALGDINLPLGVLAHEGSTILVLLNGLRLLKPLNHQS